jgi:hypothetical protein
MSYAESVSPAVSRGDVSGRMVCLDLCGIFLHYLEAKKSKNELRVTDS